MSDIVKYIKRVIPNLSFCLEGCYDECEFEYFPPENITLEQFVKILDEHGLEIQFKKR